ncbi:unnamed protein product [marine sediment metagenome]|uniref:Uncharacterized protein n=1 Tax=marine sediment metagenome TaxID=412755 RepID=X1DY69_9ZZZZ
MPWVSVEKKVIGTVELREEGVPPVVPPVVPPSPIIASFIDEHRKLKAIIDKHGTRGECVTRGTMESEGEVMGERMDMHIQKFKEHDVFESITEEGFCGKEALKRLKTKLEVEL